MSYRLSRSADRDLDAILLDGVARFGVAHALAYRGKIEKIFDLLVDYPEIARLRREITPPVRAYPFRPFVIIYDIEDNANVLIQRIRHGREDWISDPLNG